MIRKSLALLAALALLVSPASGQVAVNAVVKESNQTTTSTTLASVAHLTASVDAHAEAAFNFLLVYHTGGSTHGLGLALDCPAGVVEATASVRIQINTTTGVTAGTLQDCSSSVVATGSAGATRLTASVAGTLLNGHTAGTFGLRFRVDSAGSSVTVHQGSWGQIF